MPLMTGLSMENLWLMLSFSPLGKLSVTAQSSSLNTFKPRSKYRLCLFQYTLNRLGIHMGLVCIWKYSLYRGEKNWAFTSEWLLGTCNGLGGLLDRLGSDHLPQGVVLCEHHQQATMTFHYLFCCFPLFYMPYTVPKNPWMSPVIDPEALSPLLMNAEKDKYINKTLAWIINAVW